MNNKENFKALISSEKTNTVEKNKARITNRAYLRESQAIALKVLDKLDEPGWSQVRLAKEMGVLPQQITKIVKGTENLTLETQIKLQAILDIPILATYFENKIEEMVAAVKFENTNKYYIPSFQPPSTNNDGIKREVSKRRAVVSSNYESYLLTA